MLHPSSSSGHSLQPEEIRLGGLGHLLKIALVRGEVLVSKTMMGSLEKVRKCYSNTLIKVLVVG
jgi:hypothetical protein